MVISTKASVAAQSVARISFALLGGGRMTRDSPIDSDAGVNELLPIGTQVNAGDVLCHMHVQTVPQADDAMKRMKKAFEISSSPIAEPERVVEVL